MKAVSTVRNKKRGEQNADGRMFAVLGVYRFFISRRMSLVSLSTRNDSIVFCSALL